VVFDINARGNIIKAVMDPAAIGQSVGYGRLNACKKSHAAIGLIGFESNDQPRNAAGVTPMSLPKHVVKWLWLLYPTSNATSRIGKRVSASSALARSILQRMMYWWGGSPVECLNILEKWKGLICRCKAMSRKLISFSMFSRMYSIALRSLYRGRQESARVGSDVEV